jgi:PAS domain S-box-containing protein
MGGQGHLGSYLRERTPGIVRRWAARVVADPALPRTEELSRPALEDHVPFLVHSIAASLDSASTGVVTASARTHVEERAAQGLGAASAVRELCHLRDAIFDQLEEGGVGVTLAQARSIDCRLDQAIATAADEIQRIARRELEQDMEERRRAEASLHEVLRERDATLELLDTFLATAPVGFAVLDTELRYVRINDMLAALNGRSAAEHVGRSVAEVLAPEVVQLVDPLLRGVLGGVAVIGLEAEVDAPGRPGERLSLLASYYPLRDRRGTVWGAGGVVTDITSQKMAQRELERDAELRERFMAILGHDLRTPLSAVTFATTTLLRQDGLAEGVAAGLRRIARSVARMDRMIADLLDLVRFRQCGGIPVHRGTFLLEDVCREVLEEIRIAHPARQLHLEIEGDSGGSWDRDRITQVVSNLVANAVQHSPPSSEVRVAVIGTGQTVQLRVHNDGEPISPELLSCLFDPFRRGAPASGPGSASSSSGLGLGLYIAQEIAQAHGATIQVASDAAEGTRFTVELPRTGPIG